MSEKSKVWFGKLLLLIATLIWGASFLILKNTIDKLPFAFVLAVRFGTAFVVLALIFPKKLRMTKKDFLHGLLTGIWLALAYFIQTWGLDYTTPSKNAFLTTTYTFIVPFLSWIFFHKKLNIYNMVAGTLSLLGILLVCFGDGEGFQLGDALTILCGVFYALQIITLNSYAKETDPLRITMVEFLVCAVLFSLFSAIFELPHTTLEIDGRAWLSLGYLAFFATCAAQLMQAQGLKWVSSGQGSLILSLESVFGTLFSVVIGGEVLGWKVAVGFAVIFVAIVVGETELRFLRRKKKNKKVDFREK